MDLAPSIGHDPLKISFASPLWISLGIIFLTLVVYIQVLNHDFLNMDDTVMVVDNPYIRDGMTWKSIQWAFTAGLTQQSSNIDYWRPATVVSQLMDVQLYGLNPAGHHFTNLVIHAANAVLLFLLLLRLTGEPGPSGFVAAVFVVHPVHVISVAWVAERKDVLCFFWGLLAIHAYVSFWKSHRPRALLASLIAFALGLMSKPMLVTLPFLLLLLSWWPLNILGRAPNQQTEKPAAISRKKLSQVFRVLIPFAALSVASAAATYVSISTVPTNLSTANRSLQFSYPIVSYGTYLFRAFCPIRLSCYYSFPLSPYPVYKTALIFFLLSSISCYVVLVARKRPWLVVGWFWYLVALLPVIAQTHEGTSNRFTYIPLIGIYIAVAWTGRDLMKHFASLRKYIFIAVAFILFFLTELAWQEAAYWKNSFTLFDRALEVTTDNYVAHRNMGIAYIHSGDLETAEKHFRESVRIKPDYASGHFNLAISLERMGRADEAIMQYGEATRYEPLYTKAHYNAARLLASMERKTEAEEQYRQVLQINPYYASAHNNIAALEMERGALEDALEHYSRAVELVPDQASYRAGRAAVLIKMNRIPEAVRNLADALEINPRDPTSRNNMRAIIGNLISRARAEGRLEELRRDIHSWTSGPGGGAAWNEAAAQFDELAHE